MLYEVITPTLTGHKLREMCQVMAHINDKILHFFFLAAPDFVLGPDADYSVRNVIGVVKAAPELATKVVQMRQLGQMMIERFAGKAIHPIAAVVGGFSKPLLESERQAMIKDTQTLLDFAEYTLDFAKNNVFNKYLEVIKQLGVIKTGFLGTIDKKDKSFRIFDGDLRLMKADGTFTDFKTEDYLVITSYSIHYTKLYDCAVCVKKKWPEKAVSRVLSPSAVTR